VARRISQFATIYAAFTALRKVFNVGAAAVLDYNPNVVDPAIADAFYDELSVRDSTSDLPTSTPQCQATAAHRY
jgi:hypothetical protein